MKTLFSCIGLAFVALTGFAGETQINGFINVVAGVSLDSDKSLIERYDDEIAFDRDSLIGIQLTNNLTSKLSLTGQIVGESSNDYDADFSWAFAKYQVTPNFFVRGGRMRLPFYSYSDYLQVGYAYPWVTPPNLVYDTAPFTNIDGFDFLYFPTIGAMEGTLQVFAGRRTFETDFGGTGNLADIDIKDAFGANFTGGIGNFEFRLGYNQAKIDYVIDAFEPLFMGINQAAMALGAMGSPLSGVFLTI
jgi:hypothetical protein